MKESIALRCNKCALFIPVIHFSKNAVSMRKRGIPLETWMAGHLETCHVNRRSTYGDTLFDIIILKEETEDD